MNKIYNKVLDEYAKAQLKRLAEEHASAKTLLAMANHDLYFGPLGYEEDGAVTWPGFVKACRIIREALEDACELGPIWIDEDCEAWYEVEPEYCDGDRVFKVDRRDCKAAIVGRELVQYL